MFELRVWLTELTIGFVASFYSLGLTHAAALCTIGWIFYQFIERRRLNQANIDEFFRKHFTEKLKTVEEQRRSYLDSFSDYRTSTPLATFVAVTWAYLKRCIWFLYRLIRLRFNHVSVPHAMLLFESGSRDAAMDEFEKASDQFLQTAKLYSQQARIKKNEAVNALLYAGRVAAIQNDGETTLAAFKRALKLRDGDLDARKLIGEQFRQAGNFTAALEQVEFIAASNAAKRIRRALRRPIVSRLSCTRTKVSSPMQGWHWRRASRSRRIGRTSRASPKRASASVISWSSFQRTPTKRKRPTAWQRRIIKHWRMTPPPSAYAGSCCTSDPPTQRCRALPSASAAILLRQ